MIELDNKPKHLTKLFYDTYVECKEILLKEKRQYCIALFVVDGIIFAIPFRTNINHKYGYIFKNSSRSDKSGLDFTNSKLNQGFARTPGGCEQYVNDQCEGKAKREHLMRIKDEEVGLRSREL